MGSEHAEAIAVTVRAVYKSEGCPFMGRSHHNLLWTAVTKMHQQSGAKFVSLDNRAFIGVALGPVSAVRECAHIHGVKLTACRAMKGYPNIVWITTDGSNRTAEKVLSWYETDNCAPFPPGSLLVYKVTRI